MTREMILIQKVREASAGTVNVLDCAQELQSLSQAYVQSILQAMRQNQQEESCAMLKSHRRLRKAIANLEKTEKEILVYECGIFAGVYRVLEETNRAGREQEAHRKALAPLERKHVDEVLNYLYQNPDARHGRMAVEVGISGSYLTEILNLLLTTGYVSRYGERKNRRYILTKAGRQARGTRTEILKKREELIDIEFTEVKDKDKYMRERFRETKRHGESEEEEYAKWKKCCFGATADFGRN